MDTKAFTKAWLQLDPAKRRELWRAAWLKRCREAELATRKKFKIDEQDSKHEPIEYDRPKPPPAPPPKQIEPEPVDAEQDQPLTQPETRLPLYDEFPLWITSTIPLHGRRRPVYNNSEGERSPEFWYYLGSALAAGDQAMPSARLKHFDHKVTDKRRNRSTQ